MMVLIFLYNLVALPIILLLSIIFSIFNTKIRKGLIGRFNSFSALKSFPTNKFSQIYWFHCASFGEYQQVETLIEQIKKRDQGIGIITSFFSPSGFENVNDRNIDLKIYLPFDFIFSSKLPIIEAANNPAFKDPFIGIVATGHPLGMHA